MSGRSAWRFWARALGVACACVLVWRGFVWMREARLDPADLAPAWEEPTAPEQPSWAGGPWQPIECWFDDVPGARCAWLRPTIQDATASTALPVVILPPARRAASDVATVYLSGGPGGSAYLHQGATAAWAEWARNLGLDHDLVLYDPRGTGYALPALGCEGQEALVREGFSRPFLSRADAEAMWRDYEDAIRRCAASLPASDLARALHSTPTYASDVRDLVRVLRERLGYREVALYGVSYGSRLAVASVAEPGHGVDRILLDSWYPAGTDLVLRSAQSWDEALRDFADWCLTEPACDDRDAGLRERMHALLAMPPRVLGTVRVDLDEISDEDAPLDIVVTHLAIPGLLLEAMAAGIAVETLPQRIDEALRGDWTPEWHALLQSVAWSQLDAGFSPLVLALAECADSGEYDLETGRAALAPYPELAPVLDEIEASHGFCARLGVPPRVLRPQPVDVPARVVALQLDPVTPWRAALAAMPQLSRGRFHLLRGAGHGVADQSECGARAIGRWLNRADDGGFAHCDEVPIAEP